PLGQYEGAASVRRRSGAEVDAGAQLAAAGPGAEVAQGPPQLVAAPLDDAAEAGAIALLAVGRAGQLPGGGDLALRDELQEAPQRRLGPWRPGAAEEQPQEERRSAGGRPGPAHGGGPASGVACTCSR